MVLFPLCRVHHNRLWQRTCPHGHLLVQVDWKICSSLLAPFHLMFRRSFAGSCDKKISYDSRDGHRLDLHYLRDVAGKVCHYRPDTAKPENGRGGSLLCPYLGGVVDSGRVHLSLHASLCPVYKGFSYRSDIGGKRR